jgi:hypothetical protein
MTQETKATEAQDKVSEIKPPEIGQAKSGRLLGPGKENVDIGVGGRCQVTRDGFCSYKCESKRQESSALSVRGRNPTGSSYLKVPKG